MRVFTKNGQEFLIPADCEGWAIENGFQPTRKANKIEKAFSNQQVESLSRLKERHYQAKKQAQMRKAEKVFKGEPTDDKTV